MGASPIVEGAVELRGLRKAYRGAVAVDGVDLTVARGEIFALLGPRAAGKTAIVEICEGFRRPDAGTVSVLGADPLRGDSRWRSRIGVVAQQSDDFADVTVAEAVRIMAAYFPHPRDVAEVIVSTGLADVRDTRGAKLSRAQRRRLDVALGIVGRPELLFLDEPTAAFDSDAQPPFWDLIASLNDDGTTILLATHFLDEVERLAGRVGVIAGGRLLDVGTPDTIGGRDAAAATVRWLGADGPREVRTTEPTAVVARLSGEFDREVPGLVVERPTLEDVYVRMIQRATR